MLKGSPLLLGEPPLRQRDPPRHPMPTLKRHISFWTTCIISHLHAMMDIGDAFRTIQLYVSIWEHNTQADFSGALHIEACIQHSARLKATST